MKMELTNKAVKTYFRNIRSCGYCEIQFLLRGLQPIAYTSGKYGWNYDVYNIYGITICTGYRNMPGKRLEHITEYERKAMEVWHNYNLSYDEKLEKSNQLLFDFCMKNSEVK